MTEELDTAHRYRQRAEELNMIALEEASPTTRATLRNIAADYVRMAETLEAIDKSNRAISRARSDP